MQNLHPTLWRTCRMLSGPARVRLLRCLHERPGRNVSELAREVGIGLSDASQELRRIQSRGLLQSDRRGVSLIYRMGTDPQVASASPIMKALRTAFSADGPDRDEKILAAATGLGHPKRIAMLQSIIGSPKSTFALHRELRTNFANVQRHVQQLIESGLVRRDGRTLHYVPPVHPLAKALVKLLPE